MDIKGRIHSFETFGTVDGPGIRFVVFMQGCPFRCVYCHNPDTWNVDAGTEYSVNEVVERVMRYTGYYGTEGGITVSGGEPLTQLDFLISLFKECKLKGINTALDTNGYFGGMLYQQESHGSKQNNRVLELLKYTDVVLLDIKHMDSQKHKKLTGFENSYVLSFAKLLDELKVPVWIRYVVVPGITDDQQWIDRLYNFLKEMSNIKKIEFLPFHKLGSYKWEQLGLDFSLTQTREPLKEDIEKLTDRFSCLTM